MYKKLFIAELRIYSMSGNDPIVLQKMQFRHWEVLEKSLNFISEKWEPCCVIFVA